MGPSHCGRDCCGAICPLLTISSSSQWRSTQPGLLRSRDPGPPAAAAAAPCQVIGRRSRRFPLPHRTRKRRPVPSPSPAPCASFFPSSASPFLCESQPPATSLQKSESWRGSREMGPAACETTDMRYEEWEMREQTHTHSLVLTLIHTHTHTHTKSHTHTRATDGDYSGLNGVQWRK